MYHNPEKDGSRFAVMLNIDTCCTYKDYTGKYEDADVYTREFFNVELFTGDMPDEAIQTRLSSSDF